MTIEETKDKVERWSEGSYISYGSVDIGKKEVHIVGWRRMEEA